MTTLIANVGTSDITIKVGKYYLPIGFDRQEPNLQEPTVDTPEGAVWHNRKALLSELFVEELNLHPKARFREVSAALLAVYRRDPETWHPKIMVGRIWGVIQAALAAGTPVRAHLIVTDQPSTEKNGHPTDTVYAFDLIQAWLARQDESLFSEKSLQIELLRSSVEFSAVDEDKLHEYYHRLFQQVASQETVHLSVKGGTHQMQQALKIQALASNTRGQIFLSPKPDVISILRGNPSACQRVAYWRYQQNQKYQTVQLLLERWDFDGAAVLLQDWQRTLQALVTDDEAALDRQQKKVAQAIIGLQKAVAYLNLDTEAANRLDTGDRDLEATINQFNQPENLYAQCKIYAELKQISHFLSRMGSFYEVTQNCLIT